MKFSDWLHKFKYKYDTMKVETDYEQGYKQALFDIFYDLDNVYPSYRPIVLHKADRKVKKK